MQQANRHARINAVATPRLLELFPTPTCLIIVWYPRFLGRSATAPTTVIFGLFWFVCFHLRDYPRKKA
jgi:hypothetical protein